MKIDRIKEHRRCLAVARRHRRFATDKNSMLWMVPTDWNMSQSQYSAMWMRESLDWFNRAIKHRRCLIAEKEGSTV